MSTPFNQLYQDVAHALAPFYASDLLADMADFNLEPSTYNWVLHIYGRYPAPFTLADWLTYYHADTLTPDLLRRLYDTGHILEEQGGFVLTEPTVAWLQQHLSRDRAAIAAIPVPNFDLAPIAAMFAQLMRDELVAAHTRHLHRLRPAADTNPLVMIDHALTELTTTLDASGLDALTERLFDSTQQTQLHDGLSQLREHLYLQVAQKAWGLIEEIRQQLAQIALPSRRAMIEELGYQDGAWFLLYCGLVLDPPSLSGISEFAPYGNPAHHVGVLDDLVERGVVTRRDDDGYTLTVQGRDHIGRIFGAVYEKFEQVDGLPTEQLFDLIGMLQRIVNTIHTTDGVYRFATNAVHRLQPPRPHPLSIIDHLFDEIASYRDDAHVGAWRTNDVSGHAWEAFTYLWRGEGSTAEQLAERLPFRRYGVEGYRAALEQLLGREWITATGDGYTLTDSGRDVREAAERTTDERFYAPWLTLGRDLPSAYNLLSALQYGLGRLID